MGAHQNHLIEVTCDLFFFALCNKSMSSNDEALSISVMLGSLNDIAASFIKNLAIRFPSIKEQCHDVMNHFHLLLFS